VFNNEWGLTRGTIAERQIGRRLVLQRLNEIWQRLWSEFAPWISSALFVSAVVVGFYILYEYLPDEFKVATPAARSTILWIVAILYLFQVAGTYRILLQGEKKLRQLEEAFRYDKRGTLYNGSEPNIAFRIVTFRGMLGGLANKLGTAELQNVLTEVGQKAASDFAVNLENIYNLNVPTRIAAPHWAELSCEQKIDAWADYDSATGWGIVTAAVPRNTDRVTVTVTHLRGLFDRPEGLHFAWFLAGYCETVLTKILEGHNRGTAPGRYQYFTRATLVEGITQKSSEIVEFSFRWV
jgi:uncharacterized membrane protein